MKWGLVAMSCGLLAAACSTPAPAASTPVAVQARPGPTASPVPVRVQAVAPEAAPSAVVRPISSPAPANLPLSVVAGHSGGDLRVSLDVMLLENAFLMFSTLQAASNARLDELIGVSAMLDSNTLKLGELVGAVRGTTAAQALVDALRAENSDFVNYAQGQQSVAADLDQQRSIIAPQLASGDFSEEQAEDVLKSRTQLELAVADSLLAHDTGQAAARLASLQGASDDLGGPLSAALAASNAALSPGTTQGADVDLRLHLNMALLEHVYLTGAAMDAAADHRPGDAQVYATAANQAGDDFANRVGTVFGADVGNGLAERLRTETTSLVSAAGGGDRTQAGQTVDRLRGEIDAALAAANPLLAPGLVSEQLRASDQALLTAADAFVGRDFTTAYSRLHDSGRQAQRPADTLATSIIDRYPGQYLVLPTPPALSSTTRNGRPSRSRGSFSSHGSR